MANAVQAVRSPRKGHGRPISHTTQALHSCRAAMRQGPHFLGWLSSTSQRLRPSVRSGCTRVWLAAHSPPWRRRLPVHHLRRGPGGVQPVRVWPANFGFFFFFFWLVSFFGGLRNDDDDDLWMQPWPQALPLWQKPCLHNFLFFVAFRCLHNRFFSYFFLKKTKQTKKNFFVFLFSFSHKKKKKLALVQEQKKLKKHIHTFLIIFFLSFPFPFPSLFGAQAHHVGRGGRDGRRGQHA